MGRENLSVITHLQSRSCLAARTSASVNNEVSIVCDGGFWRRASHPWRYPTRASESIKKGCSNIHEIVQNVLLAWHVVEMNGNEATYEAELTRLS